MQHIDDVIVQDGKIVVSHLPFPDGQRVRVIVADSDAAPIQPLSIEEVRRQLKGGVVRFDDPFEPMIPSDHWEMLK